MSVKRLSVELSEAEKDLLEISLLQNIEELQRSRNNFTIPTVIEAHDAAIKARRALYTKVMSAFL
jgi:hypothetical protein